MNCVGGMLINRDAPLLSLHTNIGKSFHTGFIHLVAHH